MLQQLEIRNYALIEHLDISFRSGFSSITGETGAGKSIILGALNLLLGQRAETSVLKDVKKKSIVEGTFDVTDYQLQALFEDLDLDYDSQTIFRREILPSGKSRAFINDVPVTLAVLKQISSRLVDIHSQDNTHSLNDRAFQLKVVDAFADNVKLRKQYYTLYREYRKLQNDLHSLEEENARNSADLDYFRFQLEQLESAKLQRGEQSTLEQEQETMQYAEDIQASFFSIYNNVEEEGGVLEMLNTALQTSQKAALHNATLQELCNRLESAIIELRDVSAEAEARSESLEFNPARLEEISTRLSLIYELQQKHRVDDVEDLLALQEELALKVLSIDSFEENIKQLQDRIAEHEKNLSKCSKELTKSRQKAIQPIVSFIGKHLKNLGMPNAGLEISCTQMKDYTSGGKDEISFLFSANKNAPLQEVGKVASGGEKSRLMFTIKLLLAQKEVLPTIIFDEIDTGVSGEVARKMGLMMREMGEEMQVISITHLPQVASCACQQYKVYKYDEEDRTLTQIVQLQEKERLEEIARLLSGDKMTDAALKNAKELMLS